MPTVNIHKAKTDLSRLVDAVERGEVAEIIIARNGKPAARLAPLEPQQAVQRIGVAKGKFIVPDPDPELDAEIAALFLGESPKSRRRRK
ncbi:MAG: type II toxin-antitoxin system Phd/YefM family antitoxin [Parvularculaceae bacterium]